MTNEIALDQFDKWLAEGSPVAALVMRQWLLPVEGPEAVFFPPTYAPPKAGYVGEWPGYSLDRLPDGSTVCQIDSVGSQANRMEPLFKLAPYRQLVPRVTIAAEGQEFDLLDIGHRAADALVRFSSLGDAMDGALRAAQAGNLQPLAKIAPTSLVFGLWDSRGTRLKLPRIVRSVIRAYQVDLLHRSAQYVTVAGQLMDGEAETATEGTGADLGLAHVPSPWSHGGVRLRAGGEIRRDAALNLAAVRALGAPGDSPPEAESAAQENAEATRRLRRYVLGLALVAFTAWPDTWLREGCQLVPDAARPAQWQLVSHDGSRDGEFRPEPKQALKFAKAAADAFGVGPEHTAQFDAARAHQAKREAEQGKAEKRAKKRK